MSRTFDPARHCGAKTNPLIGEQPCRQFKGAFTDHSGSGNCWLHGGRSPNGRKYAERERLAALALAAFADLSLAKIADALARESASRAFANSEEDAEDFVRHVTAFHRAAEAAQGSKVTIESKIAFLAQIPDVELNAAIAEVERMLAERRATR